MRGYAFALAAAVPLAYASPAPAPQQLDFAAISAAPTVATGPTGLATAQTVTVATTVAAVTAVATPGAVSLQKRTFNIWGSQGNSNSIASLISYFYCAWFGICPAPSASNPTTTTSAGWPTTTTTTSKVTSSASSIVTTTTSSATASSVPTSSPMSATSTTQSSTTTTTTSSTACATSIEAGTYCGFINPNDPCAPQPAGSGPANLSLSAFYSNPSFAAAALGAPLQIYNNSAGTVYNQVFANLNASVSANSYIGLYTLQSYDVAGCASLCDNTALCTAFNIYIERDPSQNPTANNSNAPTVWGTWCPDPSAITNYKCTLWGSSLSASAATNFGQVRQNFTVAITGSDAYDKTNSTIPTCTLPPTGPSSTPASSSTSSSTTPSPSTTTLSSSTTTSTTSSTTLTSSTTTSKTSTTSSVPISTPSWSPGHNCGGRAVNCPSGWMGSKVFPGPYNPQICATYLTEQNAANKAAAQLAGKHTYQTCQYVNAVYYHKNGVPYGTYCNLYAQPLDSSWETYGGGWDSLNNHFSCEQSWTFTLNVPSGYNTC